MKRVKRVFAIFVTFFSVGLLLYLAITRPSTEFDEGQYLNTFLLVANGKWSQLYGTIFFSQLPGFFIFTYPIFLLFGKTLYSARLAIFLLSLIGVGGIIWLSKELKHIIFGYSSLLILYSIPLYFFGVTTLQADALPLTFSVLSIASAMRFKNTFKDYWWYISIVFLSFSAISKLDISVIPVLIFIFINTVTNIKLSSQKVQKIILVSSIVFSFVVFLFLRSFNIKNIFNNVILFRILAYNHYPFRPFRFFGTLLFDLPLVFVEILNLLLLMRNRNKLSFSSHIYLIWTISSVVLLYVYRPLMLHQLILMVLPSSLLLGSLIQPYLYTLKMYKKIAFITIIFIIFLQHYLLLTISNRRAIDRNLIANEIMNLSEKNDYIVTDDGMLSVLSGRKTPPELVDVSQVRIDTLNLNPILFGKLISKYKPKLIVTGTGRIEKIGGFYKILDKYKLFRKFNNQYQIYVIKN